MYDHWHADIASAMDYYPGGMMMPGRNTEYSWSRHGYQGSAKDDEVYGKGNLFTTYYREGDIRLLKWWSEDPEAKELPWQSSYSFMDNNPIKNNDPQGDYVFVLPAAYAAAAEVAAMLGLTTATAVHSSQNKNKGGGSLNHDMRNLLMLTTNLVATVTNYVYKSEGENKAEEQKKSEGNTESESRSSQQEPPKNQKENKVVKEKKVEQVGNGKYTKQTEVRPSKQQSGQSRAEYVRYKNSEGRTIRSYKDSYDRSNKFQHRKPTSGNPEGTRPIE